MTLGRQLLLGIVVAFAALLIGIEAIYVHTARRHLADQLDASANETATSLALSIGSRMQTLDPSLVNTIVNPVFDRGYFSRIEVRAPDGSPVFTRRLEAVEIEQPPGWFVALAAFEPVTGNSLISAGWKQLGRVIVQPHPQFAYAQLWETALATLAWLTLLFALGLIGIRIYLSGILRPLQQIESAALAIGDRRFVSIETRPASRELQRVTAAMNSLSSKVRDAIQQESANAERLRKEAFEDPVTGRLNRRGFEAAASAAIEERGVFSGVLALVSLEGLESANQMGGIARGNAVVRQLADALAYPNKDGRVIVGRWQGPVFALFAENADGASVQAWLDTLSAGFAQQLGAAGLAFPVGLRAGIARYAGARVELGALVHLADEALAAAVRAGVSSSLAEREADRPAGDVRASIQAALDSGRVSILYQKVLSIPDARVLQLEFFSRIDDDAGRPIPAAVFLPAAGQGGLLPELDRRALELAIAAIGRHPGLPSDIAVNVSLQSLLDDAFRDWVRSALAANPPAAGRLTLELSGPSAAKARRQVGEFAVRLRKLGARIALDNFEIGRDALVVAHEIMPAYVKLAPSYTREVSTGEGARFALAAMLRAFRPLEIPVYAQGVEDQSLVALLADMGVAGYQGFAIGRPEPLDAA